MNVQNRMVVQLNKRGHQGSMRNARETSFAPMASANGLVERDQLDVPVSPVAQPVDTVLFQDPKNHSQHYYLPRYQLVRETVGDDVRYRISIEESEGHWLLNVYIQPFVAEELVAKIGSAQALPHTLSIKMEYHIEGRRVMREFDEVVERESDIRLTMRLHDIQLRDEVFSALTNTSLSNSIFVDRQIDVAVPVEVEEVEEVEREPDHLNVVIKKVGNRIATIKVVRKWLGLDLRSSKALVEQRTPITATKSMAASKANAFAHELKKVGCTVALTDSKNHVKKPHRPPIRTRKVDVWLKSVGTKPNSVIRVIEKFAGLPATKVKALLRKTLPVRILSNGAIHNARILSDELKKVGATPFSTLVKPTQQARAATSLPRPRLKFVGSQDVDIRGTKFTRHTVSVINARDFSPLLFTASPNLPPCGNNKKASRTWVDLTDETGKRVYGYCALSKPSSLEKLSFHTRKGAATPQSIRVTFNDRRTRTVRHSNLVALRQTNTRKVIKYRVGKINCHAAISPEPFVFDERLHSYIFEFLDQSGDADLVRHELVHNGRSHTYFVDARQRHRIFYLPDSFKIARWDRSPFSPRMSLKIQSREDGSGISDVLLTFLAAPVIDAQRIEQAASVFQQDLADDGAAIEMLHFPVSDFNFRVSHPSTAGNVVVDQDTSTSDFYRGVHCTLTMQLPDFLPCFSAMMGKTAASFHGSAAISILQSDQRVHIPFNASYADLAGPLFEHAVIENDDGSVSLTLINAIESALSVNSLQATLSRGEKTTETNVFTNPSLPLELAAGETLSCELLPNQDIGIVGDLETTIDTQDVSIVLDEAAIFAAILDQSSTDFFGHVTVRVAPSVFAVKSGLEAQQIVGIIVHFEGGGATESVSLSVDQTQATIKVNYAVEDLVLRNQTSLEYRYWYQVARADGSTETFESQSQTIDDFFLNVAHLLSPQENRGET